MLINVHVDECVRACRLDIYAHTRLSSSACEAVAERGISIQAQNSIGRRWHANVTNAQRNLQLWSLASQL